jgi:hypothetical protein
MMSNPPCSFVMHNMFPYRQISRGPLRPENAESNAKLAHIPQICATGIHEDLLQNMACRNEGAHGLLLSEVVSQALIRLLSGSQIRTVLVEEYLQDGVLWEAF